MPSRKEGATMNHTKKKEMQKAIDLAWLNPSPEEKLFQDIYFPDGKPTVEEFIRKVAELAQRQKE